MARPLVLPLSHCTDLDLVGGKATGLARLLAAGFSVPSGICVTTEAYDEYLHASGFAQRDEWRKACGLSSGEGELALGDCRARIRQIDSSELTAQWMAALQVLDPSPDRRWAVRSSATNEDGGRSSFAGLYRTHLGVTLHQIDDAIKDLWASLWEGRVVQYAVQLHGHRSVPAMAVVIQPMLAAQVSGVAYSIHPVTGRSFHVVVNAVPGLAAPLADGRVTPDQYVVETGTDRQPIRIRRRIIAVKHHRLVVMADRLHEEAITEQMRWQPCLSDERLFEVASTAKKVEQAFQHPVDLE